MPLSDLLLGKPLKTSDERAEQIGSVTGVPIFGLDALSSAGYGPEAALTLLISLGAAGLHFVIPITAGDEGHQPAVCASWKGVGVR